MRKMVMALAATSMALPATSVMLPTVAGAQNYNNGYYQGRVWRDQDGRYRCKRGNGTTGLLLGAGGGALVGSALGGTTTTILGAAAGGLLGRHIDRKNSRYRCR
ncbi:hypothetical protein HMF7854_08560 [Sphingomonas ginkgonis]|uniref:Glycine zipper domain-containing protein n=1 Tax=Sphingomonas ginkgonis TaxID=2315330 RepID=A0A3R9YMI1_9SPHN|nr:hypothetical protein [Sphingomonas ginkgonis]RST30886.1 hypothetical protein HMF7854_08560 [Sphingomonas ginkgonis]